MNEKNEIQPAYETLEETLLDDKQAKLARKLKPMALVLGSITAGMAVACGYDLHNGLAQNVVTHLDFGNNVWPLVDLYGLKTGLMLSGVSALLYHSHDTQIREYDKKRTRVS